MTADDYVSYIVSKYWITEPLDIRLNIAYNYLSQTIKSWAGKQLNYIRVSGSRAKGTAITLATDLDIFISLKPNTTNSLEEIYNSLYSSISASQGVIARKQNVSIGIQYAGYNIDLVPAKKQSNYGDDDHSLYKNKLNTWTKTNISKHIDIVKKSGRINEIVALKIWRQRFGLSFPSIYLELIAIDALKNKSTNKPSDNFWFLLKYLRDNLRDKVVIDPANSNNIISEDLFQYEKEDIALQAQKSLSAGSWGDIIW